mgnify:CR=1 FL=1
MEITCRPAEPADIAVLRALDTWLAQDAHRGEEIAAWVGAGQAHVALAEGETAGYGVLTYGFFHEGFIEMVMVGTRFRRLGTGSALVGHLEAICRTQRLWASTNESNTPMRALLERAGFVRSGIVEGLDEGDPELIYRKVIRPSSPRPRHSRAARG